MALVQVQEVKFDKLSRKRKSPSATPQNIVNAFNTWQFKREQPDDLEALTKTVSDALEDNRPVPFILYWGKGRRDDVEAPERQCLDYLDKLSDRISEIYPVGAEITLILTDTHAALNGYSEDSISRYFSAVTAESRRYGIATVLLSQIVQDYPSEPMLDAVAQISTDQFAELVRSAEKWYRGSGSPEQGAMAYYRANMVEKAAVQQCCPSAIFVTFNGSSHRFLLPSGLPVFYMYSIRKGVAVKPWFIDDHRIDV